MKKCCIYGDKAKWFVIIDGEYIADFLSKTKATAHAKNLRALGFYSVVVRACDLHLFS
jgi:hypothetical protein